MPKITDEELQKYLLSNGSYYPLYSESVKLYESLRVHADGDFPKEMIEKRRPSEAEDILTYRKDTYKAITKQPISKVITSFSKIRRSPDWSISFPKVKTGRIVEEESLENYCTENLPGYTSITNWLFGLLLKQNLIDANALVAVIPLEAIVTDVYSKPVPIVFNSDQVMAYDEQRQFAVLRSNVKTSYQNGTYTTNIVNRYYYIDDLEVIVYEMGNGGYQPVIVIPNATGQFPVFKVRAEAFKQFDNMSLNKSRIDGMVPFLDEAACEYSDLKGSKIQHLFPLFWYYANENCSPCNGSGKIVSENGPITCKTCDGGGKVKFSPFAHMKIQPPGLGSSAIPFSEPAGYITRDTAILELQEKSVEKNCFKALAAINMQFLDQTPLSISGDAKNVDREELNNTVYNFAEDLVFAADKVIYFINEWRYSFVLQDKNARMEMLPQIPVPQNFDLLPEDYLMKEVVDSRNGKINPLLIATLEQQLAVKKFYNKPELAENIQLYFDLDPLPGLSVDEKMSLISNKAITQIDFVLSSYMASFIKRAQREDDKFSIKSYQDQIKLLEKYAQEKIDSNDSAAQQMIDQQKQNVLNEMKQQ